MLTLLALGIAVHAVELAMAGGFKLKVGGCAVVPECTCVYRWCCGVGLSRGTQRLCPARLA